MKNYDNPTRERVKKSMMVAWILKNPEILEGYPNPRHCCETITHATKIFKAMQTAGLFSPLSQCNPATITCLVKSARAAQKISESV